MIEAVIADITLTNELKLGVKWFFENRHNTFKFTDAVSGVVDSVFPGFSYFLARNNVGAVLDAVSGITKVNVVSAPTLTVMDNRTAILQVGDQVPIVTQTAQSVSNPDAPLVSTVQMRDTGVILSVTPRVNDNGRVLLDIEQEVSNVAKTTSGHRLAHHPAAAREDHGDGVRRRGGGARRLDPGARYDHQDPGADPRRHSFAWNRVPCKFGRDQPHGAADYHASAGDPGRRGGLSGNRGVPVAHQAGGTAYPDLWIEARVRSQARPAMTTGAHGLSRCARDERMRMGPGAEDRGFILVAVLWLLALLTLIALALTTSVRLDVRARGQLARHAEAEVLADGLTRLVALRLGDRERRPPAEAGIATDGTPLHCSHEQHLVEIAVNDVGGLVDINAAPQPLLEWLLLHVGAAPDQARTLAAAIVDFRDADDVPSGPDGAESAAYQAAGLGHGPKNAPFETVTELDQVLGMTVTLFDRLRPLVTVYGRHAGIDPWRAPRDLLVASSEGDGAGKAAPANVPSEFRMSSKGLAYRVIVRISMANGGRFARETVMEPLRTAPLGFGVREWTVAPPETARASKASIPLVPPCLRVLL